MKSISDRPCHWCLDLQTPPVDSKRKEETTVTHETPDLVELGQAEALIEVGMLETDDEPVEKYIPAVAPYVEYE